MGMHAASIGRKIRFIVIVASLCHALGWVRNFNARVIHYPENKETCMHQNIQRSLQPLALLLRCLQRSGPLA